MSEYQYYEFAALERSLSHTEMAELRAVSTRAVITPVSFVNHYEWGDLKADPADWMQRYFDALVYSADWGSCLLMLRVPLATFSQAELTPYVWQSSLTVDASDEHWILAWSLDESENYDRFTMEDGSGWMRRLAPLRDELLRGDLRPLYLGWLAGVVTMSDSAPGPEIPLGLADLSPAQQALVEFLEISPDLLAAASTSSAPATSTDTEDQRIDSWLGTWSSNDMKSILKHIATGKGLEAERAIKSRYAAWLKAQISPASSANARLTVAELQKLAEAAASERKKHEAKVRAEQDAERRRQREAHLRQIMTAAKAYWKTAEAQAGRGVASGYDNAARILSELAEGYDLTSSRAAFERDLGQFLVPHAKRKALLQRLTKMGLWPE